MPTTAAMVQSLGRASVELVSQLFVPPEAVPPSDVPTPGRNIDAVPQDRRPDNGAAGPQQSIDVLDVCP